MGKVRQVVFFDGETDKRLLAASIAALEGDALKVRYDYSVVYDDTAKTTTLKFWTRPTGGWDAKQSD